MGQDGRNRSLVSISLVVYLAVSLTASQMPWSETLLSFILMAIDVFKWMSQNEIFVPLSCFYHVFSCSTENSNM